MGEGGVSVTCSILCSNAAQELGPRAALEEAQTHQRTAVGSAWPPLSPCESRILPRHERNHTRLLLGQQRWPPRAWWVE